MHSIQKTTSRPDSSIPGAGNPNLGVDYQHWLLLSGRSSISSNCEPGVSCSLDQGIRAQSFAVLVETVRFQVLSLRQFHAHGHALCYARSAKTARSRADFGQNLLTVDTVITAWAFSLRPCFSEALDCAL